MVCIYVSLGYRCSTAGILKRLGLKTESFPFDWLISRLPIVHHCIDTDFAFFLDPQYYQERQTHVTHYYPGTNPAPATICHETVFHHTYYESLFGPQIRLPEPLSIQNNDSYACLFAINHRDIRTDDSQAYYRRCIARFRTLLTKTNVVSVYIHPTINQTEFAEQKDNLLMEFLDTPAIPKQWRKIFFLIVRTDHPYPITDHLPEFVEKLVETIHTTVFVVYTNRDFIDAGEIFMQNAYIETDKICELIQGYNTTALIYPYP